MKKNPHAVALGRIKSPAKANAARRNGEAHGRLVFLRRYYPSAFRVARQIFETVADARGGSAGERMSGPSEFEPR